MSNVFKDGVFTEATKKSAFDKNPCCSECGSRNNIEFHHRVPRAISKDDSEKNIVALCSKCHWQQHHMDFYSKSLLSRVGKQMMPGNYYICVADFYSQIDKLIKHGDVSAMDIFDVIDFGTIHYFIDRAKDVAYYPDTKTGEVIWNRNCDLSKETISKLQVWNEGLCR